MSEIGYILGIKRARSVTFRLVLCLILCTDFWDNTFLVHRYQQYRNIYQMLTSSIFGDFTDMITYNPIAICPTYKDHILCSKLLTTPSAVKGLMTLVQMHVFHVVVRIWHPWSLWMVKFLSHGKILQYEPLGTKLHVLLHVWPGLRTRLLWSRANGCSATTYHDGVAVEAAWLGYLTTGRQIITVDGSLIGFHTSVHVWRNGSD